MTPTFAEVSPDFGVGGSASMLENVGSAKSFQSHERALRLLQLVYSGMIHILTI